MNDLKHYKPLDALVEWEGNYNQGDIDSIARSIRRFGFNAALRVWGSSTVMAGNHTLKAVKQIRDEGPQPSLDQQFPPKNILVDSGTWHVPIIDVSHLDPLEAKAFAIADNETARLAVRDNTLLTQYLEQIAAHDATMLVATGFDNAELSRMVARYGHAETLVDVGAASGRGDQLQAKWRTEPGQLWLIPSASGRGDHRLFCGDSTNAAHVDRLMHGTRAALCFTSPPYNLGENARVDGYLADGNISKYTNVAADDLDDTDYAALLNQFTALALKVAQIAVVNVQMVASNKLTLIDYLHTWRNHFADVAVWCKSNAAPAIAENVMTSAFEFLFILDADEFPSRAIKTANWLRGELRNVYEGSGNSTNEFADLHAAGFPLPFASWVIEHFSALGSTIYEPFCGTGTSIVAAEQLRRQCYAMELEPVYCAVILERLASLGLEPYLA